jgi:hypothetical protein
MAPSVLDGAFLRLAHPVFDLGEGLLDRIEVRRVGRQVPKPGAGSLDHLPDGRRLMTSQIIHDDDVAGLQNGDELLLDISAEALAVDWPVEDTRCREPIPAQRSKEGQRAPMAVRSQAAKPLAPRPPASQRSHVGLDPGLIDEDQALRIETGLPGSPSLTPAGNIGARLLKGEQRFF